MILRVSFLLLALISSAHALEITQVRLDSQSFAPSQGEKAVVRYHLSEPARASMQIYDGRDIMIRQLNSAAILSVGEHTFQWNGKDQAGKLAPNEAYHYTLQAKTKKGEIVIHDLTDLTSGKDISATEVKWDPKKKVIRYRLSESSRVNIRIGLQNFGPLLKTIIDWVPRSAGYNEESWNGLDQSGVMDLSNHPKLQIAVDSFTLGTNVILLGSKPQAAQWIKDMTWLKQQRQPTRTKPKQMHFHSQQPMEKRGDVEIYIRTPKNIKTEDRLPQMSGQVPIRMTVADKDRQRILDRRFEPVFFIDGTFTFENEVGFLPFTWVWDTTKTNNGIHYITANLRGYEGNFGMATIKVNVNN